MGIEALTRNVEEIVTPQELEALLRQRGPTAYWGFELSGEFHLGWFMCADKIKDIVQAGFDCTILLADWHAYINDKLGGDMDNIRRCGKYIKDCFSSLGVSSVRYVWASDMIQQKEYWERAIKIAKCLSLARVKRSMTILGRQEREADVDFSKLLYPVMQVTDIFQLDVDMAAAGIDQRKAHMLARDVAEKLGWKKPVALHVPLLPGLGGGGRMEPGKMSKSRPETCVYIHDSPEEIHKKIGQAYCPPAPTTEKNPLLDLCRYVIFPHYKEVVIKRPSKHGGDVTVDEGQLVALYRDGGLHPADLKACIAEYLVDLLKPVRVYFDSHPENLRAMERMTVTR